MSTGVPPLGSAYGYARVELSAQRFWELPWKHVIRASGFLGGIAGDAPFFEKFYIGDFTDLVPDRVLDLTPDRRQPPNLLGTDIVEERFGDFAAKIDLEYRVPIFKGTRTIYGVDAFVAPSGDTFERWYDATAPRLVASLTLVCGDPEQAADAAAEAFARALERWKRVAAMENPEGWLHRVAVNVLRRQARRRSLERRHAPRWIERNAELVDVSPEVWVAVGKLSPR